MVLLEGFRFEKRVYFDFPQSTYSVESWVAQKSRSSFSDTNFGIFLSFFTVHLSLFSIHFTC